MQRILICCPNWRHLGLECHRGLLQIAAALEPWGEDTLEESWGVGRLVWGGTTYAVDFTYAVHTNIPFAREFLVDAAIEKGATMSVHVDADTGFGLEHLFGLVELLGPGSAPEEEGTIGASAPIPLRHPPHNIAAFPFPATQTASQDWWRQQGEVVDVAATGMGLFAFVVKAVEDLQRPLFPVFENRWGPDACPVSDLPLWLLTPMAMTVGSDVAFTARLAGVGRVVVDNRRYDRAVRHVVETALTPFERTGAPGAGKKTI